MIALAAIVPYPALATGSCGFIAAYSAAYLEWTAHLETCDWCNRKDVLACSRGAEAAPGPERPTP